jgi:hypothetical protein
MTFRDVAALAALVTVASGCAASDAGSSQGSPIQPAVRISKHATAAAPFNHPAGKTAYLRVKLGMPMSQVDSILGSPPFRVKSGASGICWLYGRSPSDLRGGTVCFERHRVSFVATPESAPMILVSTSG